LKDEVADVLYKFLREAVHITLCIASVIIYGVFGVTLGSLLSATLLMTYLLNEYMRLKGFTTPLTKLYRHLLNNREKRCIAKSPLFLGLSVLVLMGVLPFEEASIAVLITGLGDGFTGILRIGVPKDSKNLWRIKTSLAGFTLATLAVSLFYEPYTVLVACSASSIVEALILKIDDNVSVPLTAGMLTYGSKHIGLNLTLKNLIEGLDISMYLTIRELWLNTPVSSLTPLLVIFDTILPLTYFAIAFFTLIKRGKLNGILILTTLTLSTFTLVSCIKNSFRRHRPPTAIKQDYSFPSNHATWAGTFTGFFYNSSKWLSGSIYALSVLTVFEALALGNHWFSDMVAGFLIGLFITSPFNRFSEF